MSLAVVDRDLCVGKEEDGGNLLLEVATNDIDFTEDGYTAHAMQSRSNDSWQNGAGNGGSSLACHSVTGCLWAHR